MINKNACYDPYSYSIDGFALIFSKTKNFVGPAGNEKGFGGIFDAFVIEIDLQQNPGDLSSNFVRLNRCYGSYCNINGNMPSVNLPFGYDKCQNMIYDVKLTYSNNNLFIYVNGHLIMQQKEDLMEKFKGFAYFGMSGSFTGNQRELLLSKESYICQDEVKKVDIRSNLNCDSSTPSTISVGARMDFFLNLRDFEDQIVPHLHTQKIHDWELRVSFNCFDANQKWDRNIIINDTEIKYSVKLKHI